MNLDNEVAPMHIPSHAIPMQEPNEEAEASIPTESVEDDPNLDVTSEVHRKAAKRTLPWDLAAGELLFVSPPPPLSLSLPPRAEDISAVRKRTRLEESFFASTDEAAAEISSHDTTVSLTASPDVSVDLSSRTADDNDANADLVTDMQPNTGATTVTRCNWTLEEDAKLSSAFTNTSKKKCGKEYKTNWVAISALVPNRTKKQCCNRWNIVLDPSIDRATERKGKWTADEDTKLEDAVQTNGGKNWVAISELIPGRTKLQRRDRWHGTLVSNIDPTTTRTGKWA
jgi:hypothetical protein